MRRTALEGDSALCPFISLALSLHSVSSVNAKAIFTLAGHPIHQPMFFRDFTSFQLEWEVLMLPSCRYSPKSLILFSACVFYFEEEEKMPLSFLTDQAYQGNHCICPAFFLYFAIVFYVLQSKGVVTEMVARLVLPPLNEHRMLSGPIGCVICQFGMVKCIPVQNQKSAHPPVDALLKIISTTHRITPVLH